MKTDTKFTGKATDGSYEGLYSVSFYDGDVETNIEKCDMEMYGAKKLKLQASG